jgi:hypothetical protein
MVLLRRTLYHATDAISSRNLSEHLSATTRRMLCGKVAE